MKLLISSKESEIESDESGSRAGGEEAGGKRNFKSVYCVPVTWRLLEWRDGGGHNKV